MNEKIPDELDERNEGNEEKDDLNERQSLGLSPAADLWVDSDKPGDPTGTSQAPSPLPSNLNDPIHPWTPSEHISLFTVIHMGKGTKDLLFRRVQIFINHCRNLTVRLISF
jgi:hypothetical protein